MRGSDKSCIPTPIRSVHVDIIARAPDDETSFDKLNTLSFVRVIRGIDSSDAFGLQRGCGVENDDGREFAWGLFRQQQITVCIYSIFNLVFHEGSAEPIQPLRRERRGVEWRFAPGKISKNGLPLLFESGPMCLPLPGREN